MQPKLATVLLSIPCLICGLGLSAQAKGNSLQHQQLFGAGQKTTALVNATQQDRDAAVAYGDEGVSMRPRVSNVSIVVSRPGISMISPTTAKGGAAAFTLTVYGANFPTTAVVHFGTGALSTGYVSSSELKAAVPASALSKAQLISVVVVVPGATAMTSSSNVVWFTVN